MEFNVLIGGEGGQGAFSVELELVEILARLDYHFFATKRYMSRIRGGHNFHMLRIADRPVHALSGEGWEMVVALDDETEALHRPALRDGGLFLSRALTVALGADSRKRFGEARAANTVLAGIVLAAIGVTAQRLAEAAGAAALERLKQGLSWAAEQGIAGRYPVAASAACPIRLSGNQALTFGALAGGCRFMAGYPMTPGTSILHDFSEAAEVLPVHFEQAEDEIAAINMALGASYAGLRSMVATSGGGFALMQEGVSLAGMTETPVVIALAQRPGPATGLPTRTEQGDLDFVLHAGHGEFPRVLFAPGSIVEAITLARRSFELADRFQIPVFLLTDQYLADSYHAIEEGRIPLESSDREYPDAGADYRRYRFTESGISPLAFPGLSDAMVRLDSDEHDEDGRISEDPLLRRRMVDKRLGKLELLRQEAVPPSFSGSPDASAIVLSWGSNRLIVEEAVERLAADGHSLAALHFAQVYPLAPAMVAPHGLENKRLICVENNATAQFAGLLRRELRIAVDASVLKYDGDCFTVRELCERIAALL